MLVLGKHPLDCRSYMGYLSSFTLTQCDQPWGGCLNSLNTMFSLMWSEDSNILHVIRRDRWLMGPDSEQELLKESSHLRVGESLTGEQVPSCLLCSPHPSVCPISAVLHRPRPSPSVLQEDDSTEESLWVLVPPVRLCSTVLYP